MVGTNIAALTIKLYSFGFLRQVEALQISVLIIACIFGVWYLFFFLRPFLRELRKERQGVARLLSGVPSGLDPQTLLMTAFRVRCWCWLLSLIEGCWLLASDTSLSRP